MFENRSEAGLKLAEALKKYRKDNPIVLAIPRGGIIPGVIVSRELNAEFSLVITRKLGLPTHPEAAFGAIAEDKSLYLNPMVQEILSKEMIEKVIRKEEKEIKRRVNQYRKGNPLPPLKDRTIILIDDGIATGSTLFVTIDLCKKQRAGKIIVAAPVSGMKVYEKLKSKTDDLVVLEIQENFNAVSQAYRDFKNLSDKEALQWLNKSIRQNTST